MEERVLNNWKTIWNKREADESRLLTLNDSKEIWRELKRIDGFDVEMGDSIEAYYDAFYKIWQEEYALLDSNIGCWNSIFEVGCGAGATLYLFSQMNKAVSGIDYSRKSIDIAKTVLKEADIKCMEADCIPTTDKFDVVMADSVFAYFQDEEYASIVLEKMYEKSNKAVLITEIFDEELKDVCMQYRRAKIQNYDEKYKNLDKLFIPKSMFRVFAKKTDCELIFTSVENPYYWNSQFMYNVLLVK